MSEQENRGGAAFEEEFSALEQAAPQGGGGHGRHHGLHPACKAQGTAAARMAAL